MVSACHLSIPRLVDILALIFNPTQHTISVIKLTLISLKLCNKIWVQILLTDVRRTNVVDLLQSENTQN